MVAKEKKHYICTSLLRLTPILTGCNSDLTTAYCTNLTFPCAQQVHLLSQTHHGALTLILVMPRCDVINKE